MGVAVFIGMGSNLGDRKAHLDAAIAALRATPGVAVVAVSSYRETPPVGGPAGQGAFLNAAAALDTSLSPTALLAVLQAIETAEGRVRSARWGERTLDLDLLLYGDRRSQIVEPADAQPAGALRLEVPHPWLRFRRFVLAPLAEIAPDALDPVTRSSVASLLANVDRRPSYVAICDPRRRFEHNVPMQLAAALHGVNSGSRLEYWALDFAVSYPDGFAEWCSGSALRQIRDCLDHTTWLRYLSLNRWLVTGFWFESFVHYASGGLIWSQREEFHAAADALRPALLVPTFVVADPADVAFYQGPIPILAVPADGAVDVASTVLDACAATRAG